MPKSKMSKIKHVGNYFILGKQGREVAKISEIQLLECLEILHEELDTAFGKIYWPGVIEYLQGRRKEKMVARTK